VLSDNEANNIYKKWTSYETNYLLKKIVVFMTHLIYNIILDFFFTFFNF